jgi:hypothetical protein
MIFSDVFGIFKDFYGDFEGFLSRIFLLEFLLGSLLGFRWDLLGFLRDFSGIRFFAWRFHGKFMGFSMIYWENFMDHGHSVMGYPLVMTNIANWNIPTINGGFVRWEHHLFRLGSSIPWLC